MDLTDEQLALHAQTGNKEAFGELAQRYQSRLLRYGGKLLFNRSDLEDVSQEILIKAYKNLKSFDASRKFSTWIYRIAHNEFINHGKKFSRQIIDYFDFEAFLPSKAYKNSPADDFDREEVKQALESSLNQLSVKYREPVVLHYFEGLDYKEIAEVLKLPINTVGIRIMRAKQQLKKTFNHNHD